MSEDTTQNETFETSFVDLYDATTWLEHMVRECESDLIDAGLRYVNNQWQAWVILDG